MTDMADRFRDIWIRGRSISAEISEAVTNADISLSSQSITELSIDLADPGLYFSNTGAFTLHAPVDYQDLKLEIASYTFGGGPAGTGGINIKARSIHVYKLRARRGAMVLTNASPSDFVTRECQAVGVKSIIQPSAKRPQVARDVPAAHETYLRGTEVPSSWSTFQRLAEEIGFICFESAGIVYFGQPTWLITKAGTVPAGWRNVEDQYKFVQPPECTNSADSQYGVTITGDLPFNRAKDMRPGKALKLIGMPTFDGTYLITDVSFDVGGRNNVSITAVHPENPVPQPPDSSSDSSSGTVNPQTGTKSVYDFVATALAQAGDTYQYGAEASLSDPDPDAFDCSELVQWACARVGVTFPDGSGNQYAACQRAGLLISISKAVSTRGALLFEGPGGSTHVAISLGDGRTIEARGRAYGVNVFSAANRPWSGAGLIPGMSYA